MPKARPYISKFFTLSHYNPNTGNYAVGHRDYCFMSFWIVLLTGLRAGFMKYVLAPLAKRWGVSKKDATRFAEQGWMLVYYNIFWPLGMVSTLDPPARYVATDFFSTYTTNRHTFSTCGSYGPTGPRESSMGLQRDTSSGNGLSGSNRSL